MGKSLIDGLSIPGRPGPGAPYKIKLVVRLTNEIAVSNSNASLRDPYTVATPGLQSFLNPQKTVLPEALFTAGKNLQLCSSKKTEDVIEDSKHRQCSSLRNPSKAADLNTEIFPLRYPLHEDVKTSQHSLVDQENSWRSFHPKQGSH